MSPAHAAGSAGSKTRPVLQIVGLAKSFAAVRALVDFDLGIAAGEVHAVLGENGSGKSTLIKLLSGFHQPDAGRVELDGARLDLGSTTGAYDMGCRFVHQDLGLIGSLSIVDNLGLSTGFPTRLATVRDRDARRQAGEDLRKVGLDLDPRMLVDRLSPAQRTGVAVARAMREDPAAPEKVLVLDEPTATLPAHEVDHLLRMVKRAANNGVAVLYVSHRLDEVFRIADNVTVLRDGVKLTTTPVEGLDRRELVNLMIGAESELPEARVGPSAAAAGPPVLKVTGLSSGPLEDVAFAAASGEIVGIAGITGSGRDLLLGAVFGKRARDSGTVEIGGVDIPSRRPDRAIANGVAYLPADRLQDSGVMTMTARENITLADLKPFQRAGSLSRRRERKEAGRLFRELSVRPRDAVEQTLETFSGGNQQKVLFGKWLRLRPSVFLLDEPTQGVDVGARASLHQLLVSAAAEGMAVVISSSDVDELAFVCHRVLIMQEGRIAHELAGDGVSVAGISRGTLGTSEGGSSNDA
ncbi:MAG TPA: sugar ABC transporter ATP-binding protein [Nocardioides sp.]|uniref:sugar ABC transporter ATP-binding protein n=1 Tax=Nocardioides sp. TaxID=35761 RepID=UPI002E340D96|nr:sugar ABC transporter ATP-binding protein [Nocardioides sp.]HEX3930513.1 sugar ABC transporter ATP-binding protein [Nocardioides sp.]